MRKIELGEQKKLHQEGRNRIPAESINVPTNNKPSINEKIVLPSTK